MFLYQAIELSPAVSGQPGRFGHIAIGSTECLDEHHPLGPVNSIASVTLDGTSRAGRSCPDLIRKVGNAKCLADGKYHGPFDYVSKLTDVAGPGVSGERGQGLAGDIPSIPQ